MTDKTANQIPTGARFRTVEGWLTPYALGCGYVQYFELDKAAVRLWAGSGNVCYFVSAFEHEGRGRLSWATFTKLGEARKEFSRLKREIKAGTLELEERAA